MAKNDAFVIKMNIKNLVKHIARIDSKRADKFMNYFEKEITTKSMPIQKLDYSTSLFWKNNVYKVFNRRRSNGLHTTGKLGNALYLEKKGDTLIFKMHRLTHPKGENNGGGYDWDYGRYLRNDRGILNNPQQNTGRWVKSFDYKVFTNTTSDEDDRGFAMDNPPMREDKWKVWKPIYERALVNESMKTFSQIYRDYYKRTSVKK